MRRILTILGVILGGGIALLPLRGVGPTLPPDPNWVDRFYAYQFSIYSDSLAYRESRRMLTVVGRSYYRGIYQFGVTAAKDVGVPYDSLFTRKWSDTALIRYTKRNWGYLISYQHYVGDTIRGIPITKAGICAAAHFRGHIYVSLFLSSRGDSIGRDANGVGIDVYFKMMSNIYIK